MRKRGLRPRRRMVGGEVVGGGVVKWLVEEW
jgi:hypothetical protein